MTNFAADFYTKKTSQSNYKKKYEKGKNFYDSKIEDYYLDFISNQLNLGTQSKVLEVGYFVGRINDKLRKYFRAITVTDISNDMIKDYCGNKFVLDWTKNVGTDHAEKYDFICNIGHQLSFSCNIQNGISFMSSVAKKGGIIFFDVWNDKCPKKNLPNYKIQTILLEEIESILINNDLKLLRFGYGFAFPYQFRKIFHLLNKTLGHKLGSKISWYLHKFITNKMPSNKKGQNLFIIAEKIN